MLRYLLSSVAVLLLVWTAYTSLTQVQPGQRAVIRRFGMILDHKPGQGLHIGLPWGIDRVDLVAVGKVRSITIGFDDKSESSDDAVPAGQMLTGDHNLVNVQASVNFTVRERDIDQYMLHQDQVDAFVARAAESLVAEWISARTINHALKIGKSELPAFLRDRLPERLLKYQLGIEVEHASLKIAPPQQVKGEFDRVAQAETSIQTKVNQAVQSANQKRDQARIEVYKIEQFTQSYVAQQQLQSRTEADNFSRRVKQYREFAKANPDYLNALWLDEITRLYARMKDAGRIDLLDHHLSNGELTITQFPLPRKK